MQLIRSVLLFWIIVWAFIDCGGTVGDSRSTPDSLMGPSVADLVHETAVRLNPDGTMTVKEVDVPRAQVLAQVAARQHPRQVNVATTPSHTTSGEQTGTVSSAIYDDPSCQYADLWLYDLSNGCENIARRILCIAGQGILNLDTIPYDDVNPWSSEVQEYSPGFENGDLFYKSVFGDNVVARFPPDQPYYCYPLTGDSGLKVELLN
jgi:hypothetical protein